MRCRIRRIADRDWDDVVALEAAAYRARGLSEAREVLESRGRASPATSFVLDIDGRVAGYLLALPYPRFRCPDPRRAERTAYASPDLHLHDLVVRADLRGAGHGGRLLRHLTATATPHGYRHLSLVAVAGSGRFWAAHGFRPHPEVPLPGAYGAGAVYLSRPLDHGHPTREVDPHAGAAR
ncbi:MAG TPA: GNAT family N-acetyltransferase [Pilimelia sp.]|nr:GNAT family N-acetyltransferase [Pilimelia sp.]